MSAQGAPLGPGRWPAAGCLGRLHARARRLYSGLDTFIYVAGRQARGPRGRSAGFRVEVERSLTPLRANDQRASGMPAGK